MMPYHTDNVIGQVYDVMDPYAILFYMQFYMHR